MAAKMKKEIPKDNAGEKPLELPNQVLKKKNQITDESS